MALWSVLDPRAMNQYESFSSVKREGAIAKGKVKKGTSFKYRSALGRPILGKKAQ